MPKLQDYPWKVKYTPDNSRIVEDLYIPALQCAQRYWRTTGYFQAEAFALAMRGIEGLIKNRGQMRMIVGCTLNQPEIDAIKKGLDLRTAIQQSLADQPLAPPDEAAKTALELLAWMVQQAILDIKVAIVCDQNKHPIGGTPVFHDKVGIIEDAAGGRLAFSGGINETFQGWRWNWDSVHVHTSWKTGDYIDADEVTFSRLWNDQSQHVLVTDIPHALREDLFRFAPPLANRPLASRALVMSSTTRPLPQSLLMTCLP
jgi:hypothetical protein